MKHKVFICFIIAFISFTCTKKTPSGNDDTNNHEHPWPMYQHDAQHTGRSGYKGPELNEIKWKLEMGAFYSTPVIDKDGILYLGSSQGGFYAVNSNGSIKWEFPTSQSINSTAALDQQGNVYFACADKYFYSLDSDGELRWKYLTNKQMDRINPTIGDDGTIYLLADNAYAFNSDGSVRWTIPMGEDLLFENPATPAIDHRGYIFFGIDNYGFIIVEPDGILWRRVPYIGYLNISSIAIDENNNSYLVPSSTLLALDSFTHLRWDASCGRNRVTITPVISEEGIIYVTYDYYLYAYNQDGTEKWYWRTDVPDANMNNSPILDADGNIYVAGGDMIFKLSPGKILVNSFHNEGAYFVSSPVIGSDGVLYITGGRGGFLYAVN